jgi:hypothetical protein
VSKIYAEAASYIMRLVKNANDAGAKARFIAFDAEIRKLNLRNGKRQEDFLVAIGWFETMAITYSRYRGNLESSLTI